MQCLLRLIRSTTHPATGKGNHSDSPELPDLPLSDCGLDESVRNNGLASLYTSQNKVVLVNKHRQTIYQSSFIDTT